MCAVGNGLALEAQLEGTGDQVADEGNGEDGQEAVLPLEKNTGNWAGLLAQTLADEMQEQGENGATINVYMTNKIDNRLDAQDIGRVMMQSIRRAA